MMKYRYMSEEYTRDELREKILPQVAKLDSEQWFGGEFDFDAWLSDSIATGTIRKVGDDLPDPR
jgi:hypothetical protein